MFMQYMLAWFIPRKYSLVYTTNFIHCTALWDKRPREGCIKSKMALFRRFLALIRVGVMQIDIIYYQKDIGTRRGPGRGPKRGPKDPIWDHFLKVEVFNDFIIKIGCK